MSTENVRNEMVRKVNKSAEVRQYITDNPEAGPTEIAQALKRLNITPNFVSNVKLKMKSKNGKGKKAADFGSLVAAAQFIKSCGGVDNAKEALRVAEEVVSAVE